MQFIKTLYITYHFYNDRQCTKCIFHKVCSVSFAIIHFDTVPCHGRQGGNQDLIPSFAVTKKMYYHISMRQYYL